MASERSHPEILMSFAGALLAESGAPPAGDYAEALTAILVSMGSHALAGTEHVPDPEHSSVEKCSVAACFLSACSVPLAAWIKEAGHELDAVSLMHRAGSRVFPLFGEDDRKAIVDSGITLFREMAEIALGNRRLAEWMDSVHNVAQRYVLTEGSSDCVELIAPLYLVLLMAARQVNP
jgi:hypothetical protein